MKIYIASRLTNIDNVRLLRDELIKREHEITYDWTEHGSLQHSPEQWKEVATKELQGVLDADVVIVIMPGGRGTHVELGAALAIKQDGAHDKDIIMQGSQQQCRDGASYDCIFHSHPLVQRTEIINDTLRLIDELAVKEQHSER